MSKRRTRWRRRSRLLTDFGRDGVLFGPVVLVFFLHFARDILPSLVAEGPDANRD